MNSNKMDSDSSEHLTHSLTNSDLLFLVQSLGCTKTVGNVETFVKNNDCIDFLKELYKMLRNENPDSTFKRLELGEWNVVESDLLKLLVSYPEDRQLAFYTILVLVSLTEKPQKASDTYNRHVDALQKYKQSFITSPGAIKVIVNLLAECLSKEDKTDQHEQLIELIVYLFRNLLAVPDAQISVSKSSKGVLLFNSSEDSLKDLQRRFLHKLADETVLESFVYMAQDLTLSYLKNLNLSFLEIMSYVFRAVRPVDLYPAENTVLGELLKKEDEISKYANIGRPIRHSKFGSSFIIKRDIDTSSVVFSNPSAKDFSYSKFPGQQLKPKPRPKSLALNKLSQTDKVLCEKIRHFSEEVLEHCFCPLMESVFVEFYKNSDRLEDEDKTHLFYFQSFMFECLRRKNTRLDIAPISESLKLLNFEYLYKTIIHELKKTSKKDTRVNEFHAAIKLLTQYLYITKAMSKSDSEINRKNAVILIQNIFYHEISRICRRAFDYWVPGITPHSFLEDIVEFCDISFTMMDEYANGKSLTVRTERVRKQKQKGEDSDDYFEEEENIPENTVYCERPMSFVSEFSLMVDNEVASKYVFLIRNYRENSEMTNSYVTRYIHRVIEECNAVWIFFQIEYLLSFRDLINDPFVAVDKKHAELHQAVNTVVNSFFELFRTNSMLPVEALFKIKDKDEKEMILNNYEFRTNVVKIYDGPAVHESEEEEYLYRPAAHESQEEEQFYGPAVHESQEEEQLYKLAVHESQEEEQLYKLAVHESQEEEQLYGPDDDPIHDSN